MFSIYLKKCYALECQCVCCVCVIRGTSNKLFALFKLHVRILKMNVITMQIKEIRSQIFNEKIHFHSNNMSCIRLYYSIHFIVWHNNLLHFRHTFYYIVPFHSITLENMPNKATTANNIYLSARLSFFFFFPNCCIFQ